jgi:hypothetical protein
MSGKIDQDLFVKVAKQRLDELAAELNMTSMPDLLALTKAFYVGVQCSAQYLKGELPHES